MLGNDKRGALESYDLEGRLVQRISDGDTFWGNVDLRQSVPVGEAAGDVVGVTHGRDPVLHGRRGDPAPLLRHGRCLGRRHG